MIIALAVLELYDEIDEQKKHLVNYRDHFKKMIISALKLLK